MLELITKFLRHRKCRKSYELWLKCRFINRSPASGDLVDGDLAVKIGQALSDTMHWPSASFIAYDRMEDLLLTAWDGIDVITFRLQVENLIARTLSEEEWTRLARMVFRDFVQFLSEEEIKSGRL